jgi:hypothetical protein
MQCRLVPETESNTSRHERRNGVTHPAFKIRPLKHIGFPVEGRGKVFGITETIPTQSGISREDFFRVYTEQQIKTPILGNPRTAETAGEV